MYTCLHQSMHKHLTFLFILWTIRYCYERTAHEHSGFGAFPVKFRTLPQNCTSKTMALQREFITANGATTTMIVFSLEKFDKSSHPYALSVIHGSEICVKSVKITTLYKHIDIVPNARAHQRWFLTHPLSKCTSKQARAKKIWGILHGIPRKIHVFVIKTRESELPTLSTPLPVNLVFPRESLSHLSNLPTGENSPPYAKNSIHGELST